MYSKISGCRVCSHLEDAIVSELDKDLLEGMDLNTILYKYSGKFTDETKPLTRTSLYAHRKHIRRSLPAAILQIPDMGANSGYDGGPTNLARSEGFDSFLGTIEKDKEMVDILVDSAMEDLLKSDKVLHSAKGDVKNEALIISVRNQIRKALGEFIVLNKELTSPVLALNIGDTNKKLFIEFLIIVKNAAEASIKDIPVRDGFLLEITSRLRKSKEFKAVLEEERDRRDIMENVEKESRS